MEAAQTCLTPQKVREHFFNFDSPRPKEDHYSIQHSGYASSRPSPPTEVRNPVSSTNNTVIPETFSVQTPFNAPLDTSRSSENAFLSKIPHKDTKSSPQSSIITMDELDNRLAESRLDDLPRALDSYSEASSFLEDARPSELPNADTESPSLYSIIEPAERDNRLVESRPDALLRAFDTPLVASLFFENAGSSKMSYADAESPSPSSIIIMDKYDNGMVGLRSDTPEQKPNGIIDGWRHVETSTRIAEGPMTKVEFLERRQEKLRVAYKNLKRMRATTLKTRVKAHELRNELRHRREMMFDADAKFMKTFSKFFASQMSEEAKELISLYEDCHNVRDDYHPLEDSYNSFEDQLDQEEFELDQGEKKVYERRKDANEGEETTILVDYDSSSVPSEFSGFAFMEYPSAAKEYLSCRGDTDLARERLSHHRALRARLVEMERLRRPHGLELDEESKEFLSNFDAVHERLQKELADLELRLESHGRICISEGLSGLVDLGEIDELFLHDPRQPDNDSLKIADPDAILKMEDLCNSDKGGKNEPINRTKYINNWLLRSLRGSRREISNLKDIIQSQVTLDVQDVNKSVLEWWPRDRAARSNSMPDTSIGGYSTISAQGDPQRAFSLRDEKQHPDASEMLSSWSL